MLDAFKISPSPDKGDCYFQVEMATANRRIYYLRAKNAQEMNEWMEVLQKSKEFYSHPEKNKVTVTATANSLSEQKMEVSPNSIDRSLPVLPPKDDENPAPEPVTTQIPTGRGRALPPIPGEEPTTETTEIFQIILPPTTPPKYIEIISKIQELEPNSPHFIVQVKRTSGIRGVGRTQVLGVHKATLSLIPTVIENIRVEKIKEGFLKSRKQYEFKTMTEVDMNHNERFFIFGIVGKVNRFQLCFKTYPEYNAFVDRLAVLGWKIPGKKVA